MRILYAIQGTGNGHISRARDIIPILKKDHEVDILISGDQAEVDLPYHINYRFKGLGFVFGKKGGIDLLETYKKANLKVLFAEINSLHVELYDIVLNDFEPVSAWACYQKNKRCISLSHQSAVLSKLAPRPAKQDIVGKAVLKKYTPVTSAYGFHFKSYDTNIFTPVIRQEIRKQKITCKGHYTVYLPAYDDSRIIQVLKKFPDTSWQVFSKHTDKTYKQGNIAISPVNNKAFIESVASSEGVLCGAGFETPAEAMFMQKKLMVIPMKGQYEQQCNAAALNHMGVPVIKKLHIKFEKEIKRWIQNGKAIPVHFPDITHKIIDDILKAHDPTLISEDILPGHKVYSLKKFRKLLLKKIAASL